MGKRGAREVELQAGWTSLFAGFQCVASALGVDLGESPELDFYALYSSLHSVEKIGRLEQMIDLAKRRALVGPRGTANMTAVQGGGRNGGPSATKRPKPDEDLSNAGNVNVTAVRPWIPCEAVLHSKFVRCALEGADLGEEGQKRSFD